MENTAANLTITAVVKRQIEAIVDNRLREKYVTKEDFSELKDIVKDLGIEVKELAVAQKRTEKRVKELAVAQNRTEKRVEELAVAQNRTEIEVGKLAAGLQRTNAELGGLSRSVAYALENEAYRMLPPLLKDRFGIELSKKMVRTEIDGVEINIYGEGKRDGKEIVIIGETKLRFQSVNDLKQLLRQMEKAQKARNGKEIVGLILTHYAKPDTLARAEDRGIIVIQSYEWE